MRFIIPKWGKLLPWCHINGPRLRSCWAEWWSWAAVFILCGVAWDQVLFSSCQANLELFSYLPLKTRKRSPSPSTPRTGRPYLHQSSPTCLNSGFCFFACYLQHLLCVWHALGSPYNLLHWADVFKRESWERRASGRNQVTKQGHLEKAHSEESLPKTTRTTKFLISACTYCLDSYFITQV